MEDAAGMVLISTTNVVTLPAPPSSCSSCCCCSVCHHYVLCCVLSVACGGYSLGPLSVYRLCACVPASLSSGACARAAILKSVHVCMCEIIAVFESLHIQAVAHFTWLNYEDQT